MKEYKSTINLNSPRQARLTDEEKLVRTASFHAILSGKPVGINDLISLTSLTLEQAQTSVDSLGDRGLIVVDKNGLVVGSHGLSAVLTPHRISINARNLFTWCALDAIGIPVALQADALIDSTCHHCQTPIQIGVAAGKVIHTSHPDIRIWMVGWDLGQSLAGGT